MSIFAMAGVFASGTSKGRWVSVREVGNEHIWLEVSDAYSEASMTAEEARHLARQLYRLARRVETRNSLKVEAVE